MKKAPKKVPRSKNTVRVFVPDSHGEHIDIPARDAFVADLKNLAPDEIVMLGDHLDCAGTFSTHQKTYTNELVESYEDDVAAANEFFDLIQDAAPNAKVYYLEGNHEQHVERWATRNFFNKKDADKVLETFGPQAVLRLKERGWQYFKRSEHYMGLSIPGTIKLGKCFATHGISHSKHAADVHVTRFGANVVFGHVHTAQHTGTRTVVSDSLGAWCPGTLAKLQPLYRHTAPTSWTHGYHLQWVNPSGEFQPINVAICKGKSMLLEIVNMIGTRWA